MRNAVHRPDAFTGLAPADQQAIVKFLKTLQVRPPGAPRVVIEGREAEAVPAPQLTVRRLP